MVILYPCGHIWPDYHDRIIKCLKELLRREAQFPKSSQYMLSSMVNLGAIKRSVDTLLITNCRWTIVPCWTPWYQKNLKRRGVGQNPAIESSWNFETILYSKNCQGRHDHRCIDGLHRFDQWGSSHLCNHHNWTWTGERAENRAIKEAFTMTSKTKRVNRKGILTDEQKSEISRHKQ